jgi:hypothetical protein
MWRDRIPWFEAHREEWVGEKKKGGMNLLVDRVPEGVVFQDRHKKVIYDRSLDEIKTRFLTLPKFTRLNGELIHKNGLCEIALWDVIILKGDFHPGDLDKRGEDLQRLMEKQKEKDVYVLHRYNKDFEKAFEESITEYPLVEGLVFKKRSSKYRIAYSGENVSSDWIKVRCYDEHMLAEGVSLY